MKDLGEANYIPGIKLLRDRKNKVLALSQALYIDKILARFSMENSKKGPLPFRHGVHLSKEQSPKMLHPDSRSDPIGGSEPSSGCETIYWDSLPDFFLSQTSTYGYGPHLITKSKYPIHIKRTTTGVVSIKIYTHLPSPIYKYITVLLHLQIRARNLHVVNPYKCVGPTV